MFGIQSFGIWSAYLLCIVSSIICLVYGIFNWNKGAAKDIAPNKPEISDEDPLKE